MQLLKPTIKHSIVYGLGNLFSKLIGFILLPLYTTHISVSDYGVLGVLEITILILTQVLNLGQSQAYLRYYSHEDYKRTRKELLFNLLLIILFVIICFGVLGSIFLKNISSVFSDPLQFYKYFRLLIIIVSLRILNLLFFSVLRAWEKSMIYTMGNVGKFLIVLIANIYFIAFLKKGVSGILFSYILGETILIIMFLIIIVPTLRLRLNIPLIKECLFFGLPFIFTALAGMLLNMGDRYLLKILVNYKEVGLYSLGYKLAGFLNIFLIQSFSLSFLPLAYRIYGKKGDKTYYSKMLTYFLFVLFWMGLLLAVFSKEVIILIALNQDYWQAYTVVPLIVFAYIISGAKHVVSMGLYLKKKSGIMALNTILAALLNIILNLFLIPNFKMMGAAVATIISYGFLFIITLSRSQRYYLIPFELKRILLLTITAFILYLVSLKLEPDISFYFLFKMILVISFPFLLYIMSFYHKTELIAIKRIINKHILKRNLS